MITDVAMARMVRPGVVTKPLSFLQRPKYFPPGSKIETILTVQVINLRWHLPLCVRQNFQTFFHPTFFLLQLNPTYMKRILHLKNITFKFSYNWFKIDIHQQLLPLTANYLAMFKVISTTIYT